jgi:hypothetical protein
MIDLNKMIDDFGNTPLHFGAFNSNVACIAKFIEIANCRVDLANK